MTKPTYSQVVLGLLVLGSIASCVYTIVQVFGAAFSSNRGGVLPGVILLLIELAWLALAGKAWRDSRIGKHWVRWYFWTLAGLSAFLLVTNVKVAEWYMDVAYVAAMALFATAAVRYQETKPTLNRGPVGKGPG